MTDPGRPTATLEDVWRERDAYARAAREGKRSQEKARRIALAFGVAGALLGTIAGFWGPAAAPGDPWRQAAAVLGIMSAILIALSGYFGRELLTPEKETRWARARLLAEALKRECWRYLACVPPYDGGRAHEELRARVEELSRNRGLERPAVSPREGSSPPTVASIEEYLDQRVVDQAAWYERTAAGQRAQRDRLKLYTFLLGAAAVALGVVGARLPGFLAFVPVVTTATAALVAWIQGNRIGATIPLYQETATQLRLQAAAWRDGTREREALSEAQLRGAEVALVERCEEIMARENGAWRAEWLSEEQAEQATAALRKAHEEARAVAGPAGEGGS